MFLISRSAWLLPFLICVQVANAQEVVKDSIALRKGFISFWEGMQLHDTMRNKVYALKLPGMSNSLEYNTVEGAVVHLNGSLSLSGQKNVVMFLPDLRYGFSDQQLKLSGSLTFMHGLRLTGLAMKDRCSEQWTVSGGRSIHSINENTPVPALMNSIQTLLYKHNLWKLYESRGVELNYRHAFRYGYAVESSMQWRDRIPLENTSDFSFFHQHRTFTPNYPTPLISANFQRHQVARIAVAMQYRKEALTFHERIAMGRYNILPNYQVGIQWGIPRLLGSDIRYGKWMVSVWDSLQQKDHADIAFRIRIGGFWKNSSAAVQDYFHFNENQVLLAGPYVQSFQMAPYYSLSTQSSFLELHLQQHTSTFIRSKANQEIYGAITPVLAANALFKRGHKPYAEYSVGLDHLLRVFRIDLLAATDAMRKTQWGIRVGIHSNVLALN